MNRRLVAIVMLCTGLISTGAAQADGLYLQSPDARGQFGVKQVFDGFGCTGENVSPALRWSGEPAGTKSFAVTMYDPDAPTGSGWWHWVVFNLPADTHALDAGAGNPNNDGMPKGTVQATNSYGSTGYGGPCPPAGDNAHRYIITVYALDTNRIDQGPDARPELVGFFLNRHAIQKAAVMIYYGR